MPNPLPPETTPEWTADDERHLRRVVDPDTMPYVYSPLEKRWIGEIIRLRSEREAQDAEIEKLLSKYDQQRIDGVALYNDLLAIGVDRPGCSPNVRSELSRSRSVPEPNSQFVGCDEKENDCTGCDGSGRLECGASVVRSEIPEPGTGKWYSQGYVDDLNARLAATQTANASASVPNTGTALGEEGVWIVLDAEGLPEAVYCRADTAREYADDPNENKAGDGPFTVARFTRAASAMRLDGKSDVRDADGLIIGEPMVAGPELTMLREMADLVREYFDERNRPSVSWDGMPSVQEQRHRRERIVELIDRLSSPPSRGSVERIDRQRRCAEWVTRCFGADAMKPHERGMRFFEEAVELAQALGISADECERVVSVMFARPAGDPRQELGGSSLGLLGIAAALDVNLDDAERGELERIESKPIEHFRARQQAKADLGISARIR